MKKVKVETCILSAILVGIFCLAVVSSREVDFNDKYLFLQNSDSPSGEDEMRLVVLTWPENSEAKQVEDCETFNDKELVSEVLRTSKNPQILKMTDEEIEGLLKDCSEISRRRRKRASLEHFRIVPHDRLRRNPVPKEDLSSDRNSRSQFDDGPPNRLTTVNPIQNGPTETTTEGYDGWPVIWPGTRWCGAGDKAENDDDLGIHADTDKCCRAHDKCDDLLAPGETRNNLTNDSKFTKLSCKCDNAFYNCLDRVDSVTSNSIGHLYFNVLKRECYDSDYPDSKKCKKYWSLLKIKCKVYEKDTTKPKVYQWKSAKFYKKLPFPGPLTFTLPF